MLNNQRVITIVPACSYHGMGWNGFHPTTSSFGEAWPVYGVSISELSFPNRVIGNFQFWYGDTVILMWFEYFQYIAHIFVIFPVLDALDIPSPPLVLRQFPEQPD